MSKVRWFLEGTSHYATMYIGKKWGNNFPMYFVCSFPRSGSTWLSELLADYFNLPRPSHYIFPIGFSSVIHTHVSPNFGLKDCFYIYRDGRDCYLSFYQYLLKNLIEKGEEFNEFGFWKKRFKKGDYKEHFDENFSIYLETQFKKKWHWGKHTLGWIEKSKNYKNVELIKFEDLKNNPLGIMTEVLEKRFGYISISSLEEAVKRQSIQTQKNRPKDQHRTFIRKGETGDWKNYFHRESADIFNYYAGKSLIKLGYEENSEWLNIFN
ncbi:sulfotransferase domain-containing protein [Chondrinema litorale]|uniref:sulfotransferase domain-containing protein n=1 Tax=Chondrinema litorale TaxID=2994555 RepID=UPI0025427545|nr:sulfotransferase domain-containing protein [Chondrinema litorale]UZR95494.1 sulfotransferase domain-containing protein [Chondrinema litorale]